LDAILQKVLDAVPFQLTTDGGAEPARQRFRDLPRRELHPELRAEDHVIDGPAGSIPVRVYWPPDDESEPPIVVFIHGGGFAVGDLDSYDREARLHAFGAHTVVVSIDYRLAPEHPYPAAVDDVWAVTRWVAARGGVFGADPSRLAVAGDSAGATLSAVVCQQARDTGGPPIAFQLLWYAGDVDLDDAPPTLAPGRAKSFSGLPPAYIAVAGHDPLRDDGLRYAELLSAAGVPVEVHIAETLVHGYLGYAGVVPAATDALDRGLKALRDALDRA
jgi:acetyl esterase/lipase